LVGSTIRIAHGDIELTVGARSNRYNWSYRSNRYCRWRYSTRRWYSSHVVKGIEGIGRIGEEIGLRHEQRSERRKVFYKRTMATARWEKLVGKNSLGRAEARKRGVVLEALQGRSKQELVGSRAGLRREKQDPA